MSTKEGKTTNFTEWAKKLIHDTKKFSKKTGIPVNHLLLLVIIWELQEIHQHLEPEKKQVGKGVI